MKNKSQVVMYFTYDDDIKERFTMELDYPTSLDTDKSVETLLAFHNHMKKFQLENDE